MTFITKEELEQLRKDESVRAFTDFFGIDFDEFIKQNEAMLAAEEKLKKARSSCPKEKYEAPKVEKTFAMNIEQFKKFIRDYDELLKATKKIDYWYGIKFDADSTKFSLEGKVREIIWDLIGVIFGEDNKEDIADYLYGNSNFDSPEALYNELT